jgi:hypothetical protein
MKPIGDYLRPLSVLVLALFMLQGCNTLNPFCGSTRPSPTIGSLSPSTVTFTEVQQGSLLTVNGSHFVSSSVVVANGTTLSTLATSSQQLQATITTAVISAPWNRKREGQYSEREFERSWLHERWNQQSLGPDHHLNTKQTERPGGRTSCC